MKRNKTMMPRPFSLSGNSGTGLFITDARLEMAPEVLVQGNFASNKPNRRAPSTCPKTEEGDNCPYACQKGSACAKYANDMSEKCVKYPTACACDNPEWADNDANGFPGMRGCGPGLNGCYAPYGVLTTGAGGTSEYFRQMEESKMARENPTMLAKIITQELDQPFMDAIVPETPLPISLAGTDVFGSISLNSSVRNSTTDLRGEAVSEKCIGPPPEGAGISGYMSMKTTLKDMPKWNDGQCPYSVDSAVSCAVNQNDGDSDDTSESLGNKPRYELGNNLMQGDAHGCRTGCSGSYRNGCRGNCALNANSAARNGCRGNCAMNANSAARNGRRGNCAMNANTAATRARMMNNMTNTPMRISPPSSKFKRYMTDARGLYESIAAKTKRKLGDSWQDMYSEWTSMFT